MVVIDFFPICFQKLPPIVYFYALNQILLILEDLHFIIFVVTNLID